MEWLMEEKDQTTIKISVRTLVEFIVKSGDLDTSSVGIADKEAMQKGSKLHRKIQKRMGTEYSAEYALSLEVPVSYEAREFSLVIEGRADGVITKETMENTLDSEAPRITIDEIKGVYRDILQLEQPLEVHLAQAKCYAYIYAKQNQQVKMGVKMTYCNLESEMMKEFHLVYTFEELEAWFTSLVEEYAKWANWQIGWQEERKESLQRIEFPFSYREGQKKVVTGVYQTILREKRLYIEAPTGVGKTISTVFPAVKAMGEGLVHKIFYLTAKTITRTVAEDTFTILKKHGAKLKVITLTAKEKICAREEIACNPVDCPRAKGHFDRINDAVFDLITQEQDISREKIEEYATKHQVCPFEMALDVTLWIDGIICDYNYVFDPNVYLRRFFINEKKQDYVVLIDEAHNLVDRAREMYSARLVKEQLLQVKRIVKGKSKRMEKQLELCNRQMLAWKRESESLQILPEITSFVMQLMRLSSEFYEFLKEFPMFEEREQVLELYFALSHFLAMYEICDEKYQIYTDHMENGEFRITLQCMDPSTNIHNCLVKVKSAIFFSATLLPIKYYKEQLAGQETDYAIYAESIFQPEKRLLMVGNDVSTQYTRRNRMEYEKVAEYIRALVRERMGNYLVFFPSYQYMNEVEVVCRQNLEEQGLKKAYKILCQKSKMTEQEKEEFLHAFTHSPNETKVGFCVMGGMFSEGIDLKADRLIGTIIVGTGLPMVGAERELFRQYYEEKKGMGFQYAYLYNGMNKVLQSAGRVIRTEEDEGVILLLDHRFLQESYQELFPREWFPYTVVNQGNVGNVVGQFWESRRRERLEDKEFTEEKESKKE